MTVPIFDASEHVPACACGSPQSGTFDSIPATPGGIVTVTPTRFCSPSLRERVIVNGLKPAASGVEVCARKPGTNGIGLAQPLTVYDENGVAGGPDSGALHGVRALVVVASPQVCAFASGASGPPVSLSFSSLNGSCGFSWNVVVSCPVLGFASTFPWSLTITPDPATSRYSP